MRHLSHLFALAVCGVLLLSNTSQAITHRWPTPDKLTDLAAWFEAPQRDWLTEHYTWYQYVDRDDKPNPIAGELGAFGVGNGRAFTMIGMDYPLNATHGTVLWRYQKPGTYFGDTKVLATLGGSDFSPTEEWMWNVRECAAVLTKARSQQVDLYVLTFAPVGQPAILRVCVVKNRTNQPLNNVGLALGWEDPVATASMDRLVATRRLEEPQLAEQAELLFLNGPSSASGKRVVTSLGSIPAGGEVVRAAVLYSGKTADERAGTLSALRAKSLDQHLAELQEEWAAHFALNARLGTPDQKVNDYWDLMILTLKTQQCREGAVRPMSRYTSVYLRDHYTAGTLWARSGNYDGLRDTINMYRRLAANSGAMNNSHGNAHDVPEPSTEPNWASFPIMQGSNRNEAEAPSWMPMMVWDYYEVTGDMEWLEQRYEFAKRLVTGQVWTDDYLQTLSGDEPWRWVFFAKFLLYEPEFHMWSSYSSFLLVKAAEDARAMARLLGKTADEAWFTNLIDNTRNVLENRYWHSGGFYSPGILYTDNSLIQEPFEDINTIPLWVEYAPPSNSRIKRNNDAMISSLLREEGTLQSAGLFEFYDGMVPGQWLQNLAILDHPVLGEKAFNSLELVLQETAEIAEGQMWSNHSAFMPIYDPTGEREDVTARYRPWEGGSVAEGMLEYLTGSKTDVPAGVQRFFPHLPNGWTTLRWENARFADTRYSYEVEVTATGRVHRIVHQQGEDGFELHLKDSYQGRAIGEVLVNGVPLAAANWRVEAGPYGTTQLHITGAQFVPPATLSVEVITTDPPTPTPTRTPTASPTPTVTPTPTPTRTPVPLPSYALELDAQFGSERILRVSWRHHNGTSTALSVAGYLAVEVAGVFYFAPGFSTSATPVQSFTWPAQMSGWSGWDELVTLPLIDPLDQPVALTWYAAFLNQSSGQLLGSLAQDTVVLR